MQPITEEDKGLGNQLSTPSDSLPLDDGTIELPKDYEKTVPIFNSIFELFCFMILTETSKPLYFSVLPFSLILILKYLFKKVGADSVHWKYCGSIVFLVYEYLMNNSVYALLRDLGFVFSGVVCAVLIEERLVSKWFE